MEAYVHKVSTRRVDGLVKALGAERRILKPEASRACAILGFEVGEIESHPFWATFLRSLKARELDGVELVISDTHTGPPPLLLRALHGPAPDRA